MWYIMLNDISSTAIWEGFQKRKDLSLGYSKWLQLYTSSPFDNESSLLIFPDSKSVSGTGHLES